MKNFYKAATFLSKNVVRKNNVCATIRRIKDCEMQNTNVSDREILSKSGHLESYTQYLAKLIYHIQLDRVSIKESAMSRKIILPNNCKDYISDVPRYSNKRNSYSTTVPTTLLSIILFTLTNIININIVKGQSENDYLHQTLKVGESIPNEIWTNENKVLNLSDQKSTVTLMDYKHKELIILDFWTSWCSSCLKSFDKLNSIQRNFNDKIQILLINPSKSKDDKNRIQYIFDKQAENISGNFIIPTIYKDEIFTNLFKPKVYPHLVWLSSSGEILAITGSSELTKDRVMSFMKGKGGGDE